MSCIHLGVATHEDVGLLSVSSRERGVLRGPYDAVMMTAILATQDGRGDISKLEGY